MQQGWKGLNKGELPRRADQNLEYPQNLAKLGIGVAVVAARTNRLADLLRLVLEILLALPAVRKGEVVRVTAE